MKATTSLLIVIVLILACVGLLPKARAVNPPPGGGYPGGNTAEGHLALANLDTSAGLYNTAVGIYSLLSITDGNFCTGVGAGTLFSNTANENTATGAGALFSNTIGVSNTADGAFALFSNTTGNSNTAIGLNALLGNTEGSNNTANGILALFNNITGNANTANGFEALGSNTTGGGNAAAGSLALFSNTTGSNNTACGRAALSNNTSGNHNTALGNETGDSVTTANNVICIGDGVSGQDVSDSCYIGNIWNQSGGTQAVYVNSDGKLGAQVSSRRFKDEIRSMERASEAIYSLRPVSFRYKPEIERTRPLGFGLIAEEVEKISPDLVTRGHDGQVNTVRYDAINAMLLNEFLKEHRKLEKLEATITCQQTQIEALTAGLQKVTAQIESKERTPQMVDNE
jgi:hypothetical protein